MNKTLVMTKRTKGIELLEIDNKKFYNIYGTTKTGKTIDKYTAVNQLDGGLLSKTLIDGKPVKIKARIMNARSTKQNYGCLDIIDKINIFTGEPKSIGICRTEYSDGIEHNTVFKIKNGISYKSDVMSLNHINGEYSSESFGLETGESISKFNSNMDLKLGISKNSYHISDDKILTVNTTINNIHDINGVKIIHVTKEINEVQETEFENVGICESHYIFNFADINIAEKYDPDEKISEDIIISPKTDKTIFTCRLGRTDKKIVLEADLNGNFKAMYRL